MKCSLCDSEHANEFLNLGQQPLANKYPTTAQFAAEEFFPLAVYFCSDCKNVQLGTMISRERMFEDYYYLSSVNPGLVRHFETFAKQLAGARFVVDVGSNDGILLKPLKAMGIKTLGIEPSINVSKIANDNGFETVCSFFHSEIAREVAQNHGKADVIVASSVFTHLENPHQFIEAAKELMSDDGRFIIEVEYIGNILRTIQFERFYLDRIFYYSLTSLTHLFDRHGMRVTDVEDIEPHGGSLRVTVQRKEAGIEPSERVKARLRQEEKELAPEVLAAFRREVDTQVAALREFLEKAKASGQKVAGYGAPARVSTICNYGKIGPSLIAFTVDDSPLKQNRHTPGTHIPIVTKDALDNDRPDILVVFAYEYFADIRKKTSDAYRYLMPIPPKELT